MKKLLLLLVLVSCFAVGCGEKKKAEPAKPATTTETAPGDAGGAAAPAGEATK